MENQFLPLENLKALMKSPDHVNNLNLQLDCFHNTLQYNSKQGHVGQMMDTVLNLEKQNLCLSGPNAHDILRKKNEELDSRNYNRNPYLMGPLRRVMAKASIGDANGKAFENPKVPLVYRTEVGAANVSKYKKICEEVLNEKFSLRLMNHKFQKDKGIFIKKSKEPRPAEEIEKPNEFETKFQ